MDYYARVDNKVSSGTGWQAGWLLWYIWEMHTELPLFVDYHTSLTPSAMSLGGVFTVNKVIYIISM